MSADAIQIGGDHYKKGGAIQHWNMCALLGYGWEYYIAAATKYATRYKAKNGAQDVMKAIHYVEKLIELVTDGILPERFRTAQGLRLNIDPHPGRYTSNVDTEALVNEYIEANEIEDEHAQAALLVMFSASYVADLVIALGQLRLLHDTVTGTVREAPPEPTLAETAAVRVAQAADALGASTEGFEEPGPGYTKQD